MTYHQNTENPNKNIQFFSRKLAIFYTISRNKLYRFGKNWNEQVGPSWRKWVKNREIGRKNWGKSENSKKIMKKKIPLEI